MFMTQAAFSKLFYEIVLRLEYANFNTNKYAYDTLEKCILFINSYLGIIMVDSYDNFQLIKAKRLIGLEAVLSLHLSLKQGLVYTKSLSFLNQMIGIQVEDSSMISNFIKHDFLEPVIDILEEDLHLVAQDVGKIDHVCNVVGYL
jgi:hypothetical protein